MGSRCTAHPAQWFLVHFESEGVPDHAERSQLVAGG